MKFVGYLDWKKKLEESKTVPFLSSIGIKFEDSISLINYPSSSLGARLPLFAIYPDKFQDAIKDCFKKFPQKESERNSWFYQKICRQGVGCGFLSLEHFIPDLLGGVKIAGKSNTICTDFVKAWDQKYEEQFSSPLDENLQFFLPKVLIRLIMEYGEIYDEEILPKLAENYKLIFDILLKHNNTGLNLDTFISDVQKTVRQAKDYSQPIKLPYRNRISTDNDPEEYPNVQSALSAYANAKYKVENAKSARDKELRTSEYSLKKALTSCSRTSFPGFLNPDEFSHLVAMMGVLFGKANACYVIHSSIFKLSLSFELSAINETTLNQVIETNTSQKNGILCMFEITVFPGQVLIFTQNPKVAEFLLKLPNDKLTALSGNQSQFTPDLFKTLSSICFELGGNLLTDVYKMVGNVDTPSEALWIIEQVYARIFSMPLKQIYASMFSVPLNDEKLKTLSDKELKALNDKKLKGLNEVKSLGLSYNSHRIFPDTTVKYYREYLLQQLLHLSPFANLIGDTWDDLRTADDKSQFKFEFGINRSSGCPGLSFENAMILLENGTVTVRNKNMRYEYFNSADAGQHIVRIGKKLEITLESLHKKHLGQLTGKLQKLLAARNTLRMQLTTS